jgi:tRNA (adenine37-N6)-methyltransferase
VPQAKIAPPALKGKKIGVLATRSPHHPNALGIIAGTRVLNCTCNPVRDALSVCVVAVKLDRIDLARKEVHVSGLDCVDGTPILDIKPYLPCACVLQFDF